MPGVSPTPAGAASDGRAGSARSARPSPSATARTVLQARAVLGSCVSTAMAWGLMTVNPVRSVKPPRVEWAHLVIPTAEQLRQLIATARGTGWEAPIILAATLQSFDPKTTR